MSMLSAVKAPRSLLRRLEVAGNDKIVGQRPSVVLPFIRKACVHCFKVRIFANIVFKLLRMVKHDDLNTRDDFRSEEPC
jgi:hypothetical protein